MKTTIKQTAGGIFLVLVISAFGRETDSRQFYQQLDGQLSSAAAACGESPGDSATITPIPVKDVRWIESASTLCHFPGTVMLAYDELPLTSIEPAGWLKTWLQDQAEGLTGQIDVAGYPFNTDMWAGPAIRNGERLGDWAQYEQTAFYLDGLLRVGLLLKNKPLVEKATKQIEYVLAHPCSNRMLGPSHIQARWPRANFFRLMRAYYNATGDTRIIDALVRHFKADHGGADREEFGRSSVMIETLIWLYQVTGEKEFVDKAIAAKNYFDETSVGHACSTETLLSDEMPHVHGAMYAEMVHLPALLYTATGQPRWLEASVNGYKKVFAHHGLPNGIFSSEEGTNGNGPRNAHETCAIVDFSYNTGYMLMATGQAQWADMIERAVLNAGVSVVTNQFRAFQYFSGPNLLRSTRWSSHIDSPHEDNDRLSHFSRERMRYRPGFSVPCCTGSVHRLVPSYVSRMYLTDNQGGIAIALYGPSAVQAEVGQSRHPVRIEQTTDFPFSGTVELKIKTSQPVRFPLHLRIPAWTDSVQIDYKTRQHPASDIKKNAFVTIDEEFQDGDVVRLDFRMKLQRKDWPTGGAYVERGPLVYALKIEEDREPAEYEPWETPNSRQDSRFVQFNILPASEWRYAMAFTNKDIESAAKIITRPVGERPFESGQSPIEIQLPVIFLPDWDYMRVPRDKARVWTRDTITAPEVLLFTPELYTLSNPQGDKEYRSFVPYGSTCIRMTLLPACPD